MGSVCELLSSCCSSNYELVCKIKTILSELIDASGWPHLYKSNMYLTVILLILISVVHGEYDTGGYSQSVFTSCSTVRYLRQTVFQGGKLKPLFYHTAHSISKYSL